MRKFLEFVQSDLEPVKSFKMKDELNPSVWDGDVIKEDVKEQLLKISDDFYTGTDLNVDIKDIILTGSLANYNWSEKYSDYDLHILIDFTEVNDDIDLVKKYVDGVKNIWNSLHDIKISGYEVEVYIQDINESHKSSGVYSLMKDEWTVVPNRLDIVIDEDSITEKAKGVMMMIDDLEEEIDNFDYDNFDYDEFSKKIVKVWDKVKNFRKSGLQTEGGEFSVGNLVFKLLRRNGYIGKILKIRRKSYDNQFK